MGTMPGHPSSRRFGEKLLELRFAEHAVGDVGYLAHSGRPLRVPQRREQIGASSSAPPGSRPSTGRCQVPCRAYRVRTPPRVAPLLACFGR